MNLLVLGGTKFAGRAVVDAALSRGDRVTLYGRQAGHAGFRPAGLRPR
jgi:uncharacterized protein YbjT (DUF2867 family)